MKKGDRYSMESLNCDVQWIKKTLSNHLKHHERYEIALIVGVLLMVADRLFNNFFN